MSKYDYTWEKLHLAMHSLAGWSDPLSRLEGAAINIHILKPEDFPEDLQEDFASLWEDLTSGTPEGDEGKIRATIKTYDEMKFREIVERLIGLYDSVCRNKDIWRDN